jgi:hypothetical protein
MRVFPGANLKPTIPPPVAADVVEESEFVADVTGAVAPDAVAEAVTDIAAEPPIVDAEVTDAVAPEPATEEEAPAKGRKRTASKAKSARKPREPKAAKPARPRGRQSSRAKVAEAADA